MVVIYRAHGYRIVIYTQDHEPAHVHVIGEGFAKINLISANGRPELIYNIGIKRPDMKRILAEIEKHQLKFLTEWKKIHG